MLLEVHNLTTGYGRIPAVTDASLQVAEGEIVTLLGPNGSVKTSLARCLSGALTAWTGSVTLAAHDLTGSVPERRVARGLCHLPEGRGIFSTLTVRENLHIGVHSGRGRSVGGTTSASHDPMDGVLDLFPTLRTRLDAKAAALSGGQQQMVALMRAMLSCPRLLIIDELSFGLAPQVVAELFDIVSSLRDQGTSLLLVEQQMGALRISDRTYLMRAGRISKSMSSTALMESGELARSYLR
jgi:branched-chain amino acid transport system ATP-binding protein